MLLSSTFSEELPMRRGIQSWLKSSLPSSSSIDARHPVVGCGTGAPVAIPRIEPIVLAARAGAPQAPAVRIFLGTEPAQYRAERIFVYALAQVRNPDRRYEIYRMTSLPGFVQTDWRTGFTNYRFAIPDLAGRHGRALYNDVDQIYTADPAPLFDQPMGEHGYLALSPKETAVMLIDCERMHQCWNMEGAATQRKKTLHALAAAIPDCWGTLDAVWHARDMEYKHGESRLLHYTTLHLQPWRPLPAQYSYLIHPYAEFFLSLEQAADATGYELYTAAQPSPAFIQSCRSTNTQTALIPEDVKQLSHTLRTTTIGLIGPWKQTEALGQEIRHYEVTQLRQTDLPGQDFIAAHGLETLPAEDLPWVVDRLFSLATRLLYIQAKVSRDGSMISSVAGWRRLLHRVAQRYPDRCWTLDCEDETGHTHRFVADFALQAQTAESPKIWVLLSQHAGDNAQLLAMADALPWPYECKRIAVKPRPYLLDALFGPLSPRSPIPGLSEPWPDMVLSSGRRCAQVAQWIKQRSGGKTRLVHVGRAQAPLWRFDLVLSTPQYGLALNDNVVDLPAPYMNPRSLNPPQLERWRQQFADLPRPWVAVLVGASSTPYCLDPSAGARLGAEAAAAVKALGGSILLSSSPRSSAKTLDAIRSAIDVPCFCYRFDDAQDNPYPAFLALADRFIVTGDSLSMLTEACMTGRPVAVFPLPIQRKGKARLRHALEQRLGVIERTLSARGTPRQQDRLARLYFKLVSAGVIRRERQFDQAHIALGVSPLPQGLDQPPTLSAQLLENARERAISAIRGLMTGERSCGASRE
jgi:mitochondrial fission protein ELM1